MSVVILKWHGLAVIAHIASINRHVRHREAPACKRVKARLPAGTAKYRSDDLYIVLATAEATAG